MFRAKTTVQGLCLMGAAVALFGCASKSGAGEPGDATRDGTPSPRSAGILGKEQVEAVVPDVGDVPPGWEKSGTLRLLGAAPRRVCWPGDTGLRRDRPRRHRRIRCPVLPDPSGRHREVHDGEVQYGECPDRTRADPGRRCGVHGLHCSSENDCSTSINVRLDSVFARVNINTDGPAAADAKILNSVTRMLVQPVRQAQSGQTPSAKAG